MTPQPKKDSAYISDILDACKNCISFTAGMALEEFEKDLKTSSAVQHQILIIGEATKRISTDFRAKHPEIPWRSMAGMRDVLIHSYQSADLKEIWETVQRSIPDLEKQLEALA